MVGETTPDWIIQPVEDYGQVRFMARHRSLAVSVWAETFAEAAAVVAHPPRFPTDPASWRHLVDVQLWIEPDPAAADAHHVTYRAAIGDPAGDRLPLPAAQIRRLAHQLQILADVLDPESGRDY